MPTLILDAAPLSATERDPIIADAIRVAGDAWAEILGGVLGSAAWDAETDPVLAAAIETLWGHGVADDVAADDRDSMVRVGRAIVWRDAQGFGRLLVAPDAETAADVLAEIA